MSPIRLFTPIPSQLVTPPALVERKKQKESSTYISREKMLFSIAPILEQLPNITPHQTTNITLLDVVLVGPEEGGKKKPTTHYK